MSFTTYLLELWPVHLLARKSQFMAHASGDCFHLITLHIRLRLTCRAFVTLPMNAYGFDLMAFRSIVFIAAAWCVICFGECVYHIYFILDAPTRPDQKVHVRPRPRMERAPLSSALSWFFRIRKNLSPNGSPCVRAYVLFIWADVRARACVAHALTVVMTKSAVRLSRYADCKMLCEWSALSEWRLWLQFGFIKNTQFVCKRTCSVFSMRSKHNQIVLPLDINSNIIKLHSKKVQ